MTTFISSKKKQEEKVNEQEENFENCIENLTLYNLLNDYFQEIKSLIDDLNNGKKMIQEGIIEYNQQEEAKYNALILSSQKMLEIIYFEIHFNESNTRNYQDYQHFLNYKKSLFQIIQDFSKFKVILDSNKNSCNEENSTFNDFILKQEDSNLSSKNNMKQSIQDYYLLQSKRLLEETNQYSQQVLLNLNTQKEQLLGTDHKMNNISKNLQDSSLLLNKMTKWWHQFI